MMSRHARAALLPLLGGLAVVSCTSGSPTGPSDLDLSSGSPKSEKSATTSASQGVAGTVKAASDQPSAIFKTTPVADDSGRITGVSPLEVTFNTCATTDKDAGDSLKTTYDFDGDGKIDLAGHCRASFTYKTNRYAPTCERAVVCVTDRTPDHQVCKTYEVCPSGGPDGAPSNAPLVNGQQTVESTNVPMTINDVATQESTLSVSGLVAPVTKVTVAFHLTHTFDNDLDIYLIGPDGTQVELTTDNGGAGNDFGTSCGSRTVFDDAAAVSVVGQAAPFVGTFRPEGALSTFNGKSGAAANGTWRLRIVDDLGGDVGVLQCWSLTIQ